MRILLLSLISVMFVSCGKGDEAPGNASMNLIGSTWFGTFKPRLENSDRFGDSANVKMNLNEDKTFVIGLRDQLVNSVKGTFRDMPRNQALILEVEESGYDLMGKSGGTYDYSYTLIENELTMKGTTGEYLLSREEGSDGNQQSSPLTGDWLCMKQGSSSQIYLNITSQDFRGRKEEQGRQTIYFEGSIEGSTEDKSKVTELLLVVKSGSSQGVRSNKLKLRGKRGDKVELMQLDATGNAEASAVMGCKSVGQ